MSPTANNDDPPDQLELTTQDNEGLQDRGLLPQGRDVNIKDLLDSCDDAIEEQDKAKVAFATSFNEFINAHPDNDHVNKTKKLFESYSSPTKKSNPNKDSQGLIQQDSQGLTKNDERKPPPKPSPSVQDLLSTPAATDTGKQASSSGLIQNGVLQTRPSSNSNQRPSGNGSGHGTSISVELSPKRALK